MVALIGVSHTTVSFAWRRAGLKPHRLEHYVTSDDPEFETKAADINRGSLRTGALWHVVSDGRFLKSDRRGCGVPRRIRCVSDLRDADLLARWKRRTNSGTVPAKPTRSHERWHTDLMYLRIADSWYFPVTVLDAYSRYVVHWEVLGSC
jgi:transposase InsO family protein